MHIDTSTVTVAFTLVDDPTTSLLAWTTTPWTLPSNLALCVHPDFTYIKIHDETRNQNFVILESLLTTLYKDPKKAKFKKIGTYKGSEMKGWRYVPLFDYFKEEYKDKAFRVLNDMYVTMDSGTGIVHQAPAFGEDDLRIAIANGLVKAEEQPPCPVDDAGRFTSVIPEWDGVYIKVRFDSVFWWLLELWELSIFQVADKDIQKVLKARGVLIVQSTITHSVPFCWRYHHHVTTFIPVAEDCLQIKNSFDLPDHSRLECPSTTHCRSISS